MKNDFHNYDNLFYKTIAFSVSIHLLFLFALMYGNLLPSTKINYTPVYTVRLVSSSPVTNNNQSVVENKGNQPPSIPAKSQVTEQKPSEIKKEMILPIEKKAPNKKELLSAIKSVSNELRKQQLLNAIQQITKTETSQSTTNSQQLGGGANGEGGLPAGSVADEYYSLIWQKIHDAWLIPSSMAASSYGYETVISVTINRDGTVSDYNVEKSSGNSYFDQTAIRAIKRASPLPPFPPSWLQKSINIGIKFSCKEGCQ